MTKLYYGDKTWFTPGHQPKDAERADVPNAPQDLADWLNTRRVWPVEPERPASEEGAACKPQLGPDYCPKCDTHASNAAAFVRRAKADELARFVAEEMLPGQVEELFLALGVRFAELRKAAGQ